MPFRRATALAAAATLLVAAGGVRSVRAHGDPPDLAFWGNFGSAATCQRVTGAAVADCTIEAFAAERDCIETRLAGRACDEEKRDAAVATARRRTRDRIFDACTDSDASRLQFFDVQDMVLDGRTTCDELVDSLISVAYRPVLRGSTVVPGDEPTHTCVAVIARESGRLLRAGAHAAREELDRIASTRQSIDDKRAHVAVAEARTEALVSRIAEIVTAACPTLESLYEESAEELLGLLATRVDCFTGSIYVQAELVCPEPVCGNGMRESGEECDDGNDVETDGCLNDCRRG